MSNKPYVTAVVVAAGNSTRMGSRVSKQFIPLLGKPVIAYTLRAFEQAECVSEVVVVCRESDMPRIKDIAKAENCTKVKAFAVGGATRGESVCAGICAASDKATHFAIHDGARPLVLTDDIARVVSEAVACDAAALAVPVTDTIKVVDDDGFIVSTPMRAALRAAQTPQVFSKDLYMKALEFTKGQDFTDDCALVETVGARVKTVVGAYTNIKVTTPQDIPLAEGILREREGRV